MAISSGVFTTTFLFPETVSSFVKPSVQVSPVNLCMVRTVTLATASPEPVTGKREPRGIMKPRRVSPEMEAVVGAPEIPRTQALKHIWAYIKEHNLQDHCYGFCLHIGFLDGQLLLLKDMIWNSPRKLSEQPMDPENKKVIVCDEKLKKIFGGRDRVGFLEIAGLISPHFL